MNWRAAARLLAAGALASAVAAPSALLAQQPPPSVPAPSQVRDTARAADTSRVPAPRDTVPVPDSLSPDSFRPRLPPLGAPRGPLPKSGRWVFDRDALWFSGSFTLGDLLQQIPGVMLVREGWYGRQEVVHHAGQGAASVAVYLDGFALDPMGHDSTGFDLSLVELGLLDRVEVEVLPTRLNVYLFSDGQTVRRPRTETSFGTGDASTNTYLIRYLNRWKNGSGIGLGVSSFSTSGTVPAPGATNDLTLWAKGSWVPSPRFGIDYQLLSTSVSRDSFGVAGDGAVPGTPFGVGEEKVHRTDAFLRGYVASRADGMGLRFDALVGSTRLTDTSATLGQSELQAAGVASWRDEHWSLEATTRLRDRPTPLELELRAAGSPLAGVTVAGSLLRQSHLGGRHSTDAALMAELRPWPAIALHGSIRARRAVAEPLVTADTAQSTRDMDGGISLTTRPVELDLSVARHGIFVAPLYGGFGTAVAAYPSVAVRTATATIALRPTSYLTLSGWYRHPLDPLSSAYEPPHHARIQGTFRSRLLPILRRGAFDFIAQGTVESWSHGTFGLDSSGAEYRLPGAVVVDWRLELRLLGAAIYWTMRNSQAERSWLLPGLSLPRIKQRYGVRWEFTN